MSLETIGDVIRAMRFERHLSQPELAALLGITLWRFISLELNRRTPSQAEWTRLAPILGLEAMRLNPNPTVE